MSGRPRLLPAAAGRGGANPTPMSLPRAVSVECGDGVDTRQLEICDTAACSDLTGAVMEATVGSKSGALVLGLTLILSWALPAPAAELSPDIQADLYLVRAERQIRSGDNAGALGTLDRIWALQAEHGLEIPDAFWFKRAEVSRQAGLHARAADSATRYLEAAGRSGEHYVAARELLDAAEVAVATAERVARGELPAMVVLPAGRFRMGCLSDDGDCETDEKPIREVVIASFALSKHEVTFAQWDACVSGGGCGGHRPDDEGWGRADRAVVNVSWEDAQSYVSWLSEQTGEEYRLPTEAEWEYAARAGTTTKYSWGNEIGVGRANCDGCGSQWDDSRTAPAVSFPANSWALHDMHGNVWEWVQDCWNDSYVGAPVDGSAWLGGDCSGRVFRGGSWVSGPRSPRAANRGRYTTGNRDGIVGFRVARTLTLLNRHLLTSRGFQGGAAPFIFLAPSPVEGKRGVERDRGRTE